MDCCVKNEVGSMCRDEVYAAIEAKMDSYWKDHDFWSEITNSEAQSRKMSVSQWLIDIADIYDDLEMFATSENIGRYTFEKLTQLGAACCLCMETHGCIQRNDNHCGISCNERFIPMTRNEIWFVLNGERTYQNEKWHHDDNTRRPVDLAGYVLTFRRYLDHAVEAYVDNTGDLWALDCIRKLAAIVVACLERHGAPLRV